MLSSIDYSTDQLQAISEIERWFKKCKNKNVKKTFRLYGRAGSGKTSIIPAVIESLNVNVVQYLAPTGKSVLALKDKGINNALTIHKALYILPKKRNEEYLQAEMNLNKLEFEYRVFNGSEEEKIELKENINKIKDMLEKFKQEESMINLKETNLNWILNPNSPLFFSELIVCDEASMISGKMREDLESFNKPIIYIGDPFQLLPISFSDSLDSVMYTVDGALIEADYELKKIHRQSSDNPILIYSQDILNDEFDVDEFIRNGSDLSNNFLSRMHINRIDPELHIKPSEQIICGFNKTRKNLNNYIHYKVYNYNSRLPEIGERIIIKRNNYDYDLLNGEVVKVLHIHNEIAKNSISSNLIKYTVEKPNGEIVTAWFIKSTFIEESNNVYIPKKISPTPIIADFGWVISTHNAQGSEWNYGILLNERFGRSREEYLRWLYTGVTRFKKGLIIFS